MKQLIKAGLRQQKIYAPANESRITGKNGKLALIKQDVFDTEALETSLEALQDTDFENPQVWSAISPVTIHLISSLADLGFSLSEPLLSALKKSGIKYQLAVLQVVAEAMGKNKNWTPLLRGWDVATNKSVTDHLRISIASMFKSKGTKLPCGHVIPSNTFDLSGYNGCPFCGTPFSFGKLQFPKQGTTLKVLDLWSYEAAYSYLVDLLSSKTALDATQQDSLKLLLEVLPMPEIVPVMKETLMVVIDYYRENGEAEKAQKLFASPTDILRYLWYKQTGFLQIIEPKVIIRRQGKMNKHVRPSMTLSASAELIAKARLKLKYNRRDCIIVATWMNNLRQQPEQICELMHPKRAMWIRFIRGLRLAEYSKRPGFEKLAGILDKFYNEDYPVWQGDVNHFRLRYDAAMAFALLQQRPGLFARSLFANMIWFGAEETIVAFTKVIDKVPARLILTLGMYAENYFDASAERTVRPIAGAPKRIPANQLLAMYDPGQLADMVKMVKSLLEVSILDRFARIPATSKSIYIDPQLSGIPISIGDRSASVQDISCALQGTKFKVEGQSIRLFMQWGTGLPAQPMDMDLSCSIAYEAKFETCSYYSLSPRGCKHSGDIRSIPEKKGTAEYIEIDLAELAAAGAKYVSFSCNAYSVGGITPNLVVGWMNSLNKMKVSERTGVAYDPSCVQHQVRISGSITKGLVFGVLDIVARGITWLEMPVEDSTVANLDRHNVELLLKKLKSKISIGKLLEIKAIAQDLALVEKNEADEVYDLEWAGNTAAVTQLLID